MAGHIAGLHNLKKRKVLFHCWELNLQLCRL